MRTVSVPAAALALVAGCAQFAPGQTYSFSLDPPASSLSYEADASSPFTGTMTGDTAAVPATRLKRGTQTFVFVDCGTWTPTTNEAIAISGTATASGSGSGLHPTGSFRLTIDTAGGAATLQDTALDLLGGSAPAVDASLQGFQYEPFCAQDPSCSAPFLAPISVPLPDATVTSATAAQLPGAAAGTLAPAGPNAYSFSIPVTFTVTAGVVFAGSPLPIDPQEVPVTLTGTITLGAGGAATVAAALDLSFSPQVPAGPVALPPSPITLPPDSPLCANANLLANLTLTSQDVSLETSGSISAAGTRVPCPCDADGSLSLTVADIFAFLRLWFAGSPAADFDGQNGIQVADIFAFLRCWFGSPVGC